jgi:tetratricopeptide (TPR) repeat protein
MLPALRPIRSTLYAALLTLLGGLETTANDDPLVTISEKYHRGVRENPGNPLAYLARGNAWLEEQQYNRALADYNSALELKPDYKDALFNRAFTHRMFDQYDLAMVDLNYLVALHPNDVGAINNRAIIWALKGDFATALREFDRALQLNPGDSQLERNRETLKSIMQEHAYRVQKHDQVDLEESYIRYDSIR